MNKPAMPFFMPRKAKKEPFFRPGDGALYLMALPCLVCLFLFSYLPMAGLVMAFQNVNIAQGMSGSSFVGLANFKYLFASMDAWRITRNTLLYNLAFLAVNTSLAALLAILLSELRPRWLSGVFQTINIMPHFLSWAVVAIIVDAFLSRNNGFVNSILAQLGQRAPVNWYYRRSIWPGLLVFLNAWKGVGYTTIIYLAVISGISPHYYEMAAIDGATKVQQARHITLPHLRYVMGVSLIMSLAAVFRGDFGLFYNVPQNTGYLYPVTDVIDTYIYRVLREVSNVGMATAAGLYQSVVGTVLVVLVNGIVKRLDPDTAIF